MIEHGSRILGTSQTSIHLNKEIRYEGLSLVPESLIGDEAMSEPARGKGLASSEEVCEAEDAISPQKHQCRASDPPWLLRCLARVLDHGYLSLSFAVFCRVHHFLCSLGSFRELSNGRNTNACKERE